MGVSTNYTQNNYMPIQDMAYRTTSGYLMKNGRLAGLESPDA